MPDDLRMQETSAGILVWRKGDEILSLYRSGDIGFAFWRARCREKASH